MFPPFLYYIIPRTFHESEGLQFYSQTFTFQFGTPFIFTPPSASSPSSCKIKHKIKNRPSSAGFPYSLFLTVPLAIGEYPARRNMSRYNYLSSDDVKPTHIVRWIPRYMPHRVQTAICLGEYSVPFSNHHVKTLTCQEATHASPTSRGISLPDL
jgi:hypothetical protein